MAEDFVGKMRPCSLVTKFAGKLVESAANKPILDVACGGGRNALLLANLGCEVICIDKNLAALSDTKEYLKKTSAKVAARLLPQYLDLAHDELPFALGGVGGIVNVHFFIPRLLPWFKGSLVAGGVLLIETIPAHGGNYMDLPHIGELRKALDSDFEMLFYHERAAGPSVSSKVAVKLVGIKKNS